MFSPFWDLKFGFYFPHRREKRAVMLMGLKNVGATESAAPTIFQFLDLSGARSSSGSK